MDLFLKTETERGSKIVGMNDRGNASKGERILTYGLGGCTAVGLVTSDKQGYVQHYFPNYTDMSICAVNAFIQSIKVPVTKIVVAVLGEYVKINGDWELMARDKEFLAELLSSLGGKVEMSAVKIIPYSGEMRMCREGQMDYQGTLVIDLSEGEDNGVYFEGEKLCAA